MSVFRDLLAEAFAQGVTRVRFEVDLPLFFADEQGQSWIAMAGESPIARGRSGEEALRTLVEQAK